jgi:hypothetical protein
MKKNSIISLISKIFIISILILCGSPLWSQTLGDVNNNSNVDIIDALLVAQYYVGLAPEPFNMEAADVNCDNSINILDALLIAQFYVNSIDTFPCLEPTPGSTIEPTPNPGNPPFTDELLIRWGLGTPVSEYHENTRDYPWYMDQYNTGPHSSNNCGPTSVTMAIKWTDESFNKTPEDARETYRPEGGWWYTSDITNYLDLYNTDHVVMSVTNNSALFKDQLLAGNILILCLTMEEIRLNSVAPEHIHAFYSGVTGHFIVVKGFIVVNNTLYFEVYDPFSMNRYYPEPEETWLKGKDRYYLWEDLYNAVSTWWNYAIVVQETQNLTGFESDKGFSTAPIYVDPATIPHMGGGGY